MKWERRIPLPGLALGAIVVCAWCSLLSGVAGWVTGQDLARRAARAEYATAVAAIQDLPVLGVQIVRLDRAGPAARAGLQRGDVIIAVDGVHVEDARHLRDQLNSYRVGDTLRLTVLRERSEEEVIVRLDAFPDDSRRPYLGVYYTARGDDPADL